MLMSGVLVVGLQSVVLDFKGCFAPCVLGKINKNRDYVEASNSNWVNSSNPYFKHDSGGLFLFNNNNTNNTYAGRGGAVCGAGLLYRMKYFKIFRIRGKNFMEFSEYFLYIKEM